VGSLHLSISPNSPIEQPSKTLNPSLTVQQMGEWYVHEKCIGKKISEIEKEDEQEGALIQPCCSAKPLIQCHYKDKPSKIPCNDSPAIDRNGKSFW
jgi:hypothetical protein